MSKLETFIDPKTLLCGYKFEEEIVIPAQFDGAWGFDEGKAPVHTEGKFGYISETGEMVIRPRFDYAGPFSEGFALISLDRKYGYINDFGVPKIPVRFQDGWEFGEGKAPVKFEGKWGFIGTEGQTFFMKPDGNEETDPSKCFVFDKALPHENGYARVMVGEKWGFVSNWVEVVIEPKYDYVRNFDKNGHAIVQQGKQEHTIDTSGNIVSTIEMEKSDAEPTKPKE